MLSNGADAGGTEAAIGAARLTIQQVIERLRDRLAKVEGVRTFFTPVQDLVSRRADQRVALSVYPDRQ